MSFRSVPQGGEHARDIATVLQQVIKGKINAVYDSFTLNAGATTTTLTDPRLAAGSWVLLMPLTANAQAVAGSVWPSSRDTGAWVFTHTSDANTDKSFRALIIG